MHTIQTPEAYETLRTCGTLVGDSTRGEWHEDQEFREAYDWMRRQMNSRLRTTSGGILWLWAKITHRDLIGDAKRARGEVLLTVRVPRERVLLSGFDDWHMVLNRGLEVPLLPGETHEQWSSRFEQISDAWNERERIYRDLPIEDWPDDLRTELELSWQSIFDIRHGQETLCVQATVHELHANEVIRAVRVS